jgi:hypothetical protein
MSSYSSKAASNSTSEMISTRRSKRSRTPVETAEASFPPKSFWVLVNENRTSAYGIKIEKYTTEFNLNVRAREQDQPHWFDIYEFMIIYPTPLTVSFKISSYIMRTRKRVDQYQNTMLSHFFGVWEFCLGSAALLSELFATYIIQFFLLKCKGWKSR